MNTNKPEWVVNKNKVGFYEDHDGSVIEDFLDTFYGKTVKMTRCEFDNYLLKCVAEMSEFMTATIEQVELRTEQVESIRELLIDHTTATDQILDEMKTQIDAMKSVRTPERSDVHLINKRIDILANKMELLAKQTGKAKLIKDFFSNAFPNEVT